MQFAIFLDLIRKSFLTRLYPIFDIHLDQITAVNVRLKLLLLIIMLLCLFAWSDLSLCLKINVENWYSCRFLNLILRIIGMFCIFMLEQSALQLWKGLRCELISRIRYLLFIETVLCLSLMQTWGKYCKTLFSPACSRLIRAHEKCFIIVNKYSTSLNLGKHTNIWKLEKLNSKNPVSVGFFYCYKSDFL